jgi:hypothetical protein
VARRRERTDLAIRRAASTILTCVRSWQLARARLLTVDGYGHGAQGNPSACATRYINRYLIRTKLPPQGTRCRQDQQPFSPGP